jgi:DNA-binding transcriptional LysR family regulator
MGGFHVFVAAGRCLPLRARGGYAAVTTLRTLECLVAVVDHCSISKAATTLDMSQPALSRQIASLEREVGAPVVERLPRGVRVTATGRSVARQARIAVAAAEQAIRMGRRVSRADAGRIRVACVETMTAWLLLPVLCHWRSHRPDVQLDLSEFSSADAMVKCLEDGSIDVAIGPRPTSTTAHVSVFGTEEIVTVVTPGHRFAAMEGGVPVAELAGEPFVHYGPTSGMAVWVDQFAADHKVLLNPVLRTGSPRAAAQLAAAGVGVSIVPISALVPRPPAVVRPLHPMVEREILVMVAAPSDSLVQQFLADLHRRGMPTRCDPD